MIYLSVDVEQDFPPHYNTFNGIDGLTKIVKLLKKHECQATFFVTAELIRKKPGLLKVIEGYEIGCHGLKHIDYTKISLKKFDDHLKEAVAIFKEHDIIPTGFRAPYANINQDMLKVMGKYFLYDSSKQFHNSSFMDVEEIPIFTGGKAFGISQHLFNLLLKAPVKDKVFFIHPWEYGGIEFDKIMDKRKNLRILGYSQDNYVKNLEKILSIGVTNLKEYLLN